jgi:hypothetical protein
MEIGAGVGALVAVAIILTLLAVVAVPLAIAVAIVWVVVKLARAVFSRGAPRVVPEILPSATAAVGGTEPAAARDLGWAAGLLVAGVLWCMRFHFAAILLGLGAAFLTRGLVASRQRAAA